MNRSCLLAAILLAHSAPTVSAQCQDWRDGFGLPGNGVAAPIQASLQFDDGGGNKIYSAPGGTPPAGVAGEVGRWDGSAWSSLPGDFNGSILGMASFDDGSGPALHVAGGYTLVDGGSHLRASKFSGGTWQQLGTGVGSAFNANDRVSALCVHDDGTGAKLYAGGRFLEAGGAPASNIAVWNGTSWSALGSGTDGEVRVLASYAGKLYVAGDFANAGGAPAFRLAAWDGTAWSTVGPTLGTGTGTRVAAMHVADLGSGPRLYMAGYVTTLGGVPCSQVLAWDGLSFAQIPGTFTSFNGAHSLRTHDDGTGIGLYLAGSFATVDGIAANGIARWDGSAWSGLQGGFTQASNIAALESYQGDLYALGDITSVAGKPSKNIAAWGIPCAAPGFLEQPQNVTATWGVTPLFSVRGSGLHPLTYQWYRNGVALQESSAIVGTQTRELRLFLWSYEDRGQYTCVLTNAIGSTESAPAEFIVPAGGQSGIPVSIEPLLTTPATALGLQPGETITNFTSVRVGWTGELLATGTVGSETMPFVRENDQLKLLFRRFDPAPGLPAGTTFGRANGGSLYGELALGTNSNLIFEAYLSGPGITASTDQSYWFRDAQGLELMARYSTPAVGSTPGAILRNLRFPSIRTDRAYFNADAYMGSTFLHSGLWSWDRANGLQLVLMPGMTAPGTGSTFGPVNGGAAPTEAGEILLFAGYGAGQTGLFAGPPANLQLLQTTGDPAPGWPAGVNITAFENLAFHDVDDLALVTNSPNGSTQRRSLYTLRQGVVNPILQSGVAAPDSGIMTFFAPRVVAMNANGSVLFYSNLAGQCETCPTFGVWLADASGALTTILLDRGQTIPGLPATHRVTDVGAMALDDSDRVLVNARMEFAGTYYAIYGWTREAGLFPVATVGDQFEIAPGVYRTVSSAALGTPNASPTTRTRAVLSNTGYFTFDLSFLGFTNGSFAGNFTTILAAVVGAGETFCVGDGSGAACPCGNASLPGEGQGCTNSLGNGATLRAQGTPSLSADTLTLVGEGMPNSSALYFQGTTQLGGGLGTAFGDGLRCAGGTIRRLGTRANSGGGSSLPTPGGTPISALAQVTAPGERTYQVWYRNAAAFCTASTFNLTNGLIVTWAP